MAHSGLHWSVPQDAGLAFQAADQHGAAGITENIHTGAAHIQHPVHSKESGNDLIDLLNSRYDLFKES